jgi:hypothetical protein
VGVILLAEFLVVVVLVVVLVLVMVQGGERASMLTRVLECDQ